jgi:hypothetical protein
MKYLVSFIIVFTITFLCGFLAWWLAPIMCFVFFYFYKSNASHAFAVGMFASGVAWMLKAFLSEFSAQVKISSLLAGIFGNVSTTHIYLLIFLVIGLLCGFSSMTGSLLRQIENT